MNTTTSKTKSNDMSDQLEMAWRGFLTALLSLKGWLAVLISFLMATTVGHLIVYTIVVFHIDMITGILASRREMRKEGIKPKVFFLESSKMRQSVVKGGFYLWFFIGLFFLTKIMHIPAIDIRITDKHFMLYELGLIICIGIEKYSIIENFKRLGFDVLKMVKKISKAVWVTVDAVKNNKHEE